MLKLKTQSSIMSKIMSEGGQGGDPIPVLDELTQLIRLYSPDDPQLPGKQQPDHLTPPLLQRLMPTSSRCRKGSYHLSQKNLQALDRATTSLRNRLPQGEKRLVTKSRIVEYALELILDDYERCGDESILAKKLLTGKTL